MRLTVGARLGIYEIVGPLGVSKTTCRGAFDRARTECSFASMTVQYRTPPDI